MTFFSFLDSYIEQRRSLRRALMRNLLELEYISMVVSGRCISLFIDDTSYFRECIEFLIPFLLDHYFVDFITFLGRVEEFMNEFRVIAEDEESATFFVEPTDRVVAFRPSGRKEFKDSLIVWI